MRTLALVPLALVSQLGCAGAGDTADSAPACTEAQAAVDWDTWGAGFFATYCRSCHSEGSPSRFGAPVGLDFDTLGQVRAAAAAIRRTALDAGTMPVGGGVLPEDLERLDLFLACGL